MSIPKVLYGNTLYVPQDQDELWGPDETQLGVSTVDGLTAISGIAGTLIVPRVTRATLALTNGATISTGGVVAYGEYRVSGSGAPVTLGSPAIAPGSVEGQTVTLRGTSANTVTITHGSGTDQNGDIVLGIGDSITYRWNVGTALWEEIGRST